MYPLYRDRPLILLCLLLTNIVLSAFCLYADPVINNDGVTYLAIAQLVMEGQWQKAFDAYSWPFYSIFIAFTAKVLFINAETAAYLLNTLFVTSLTIAFVCIVSELSNNNKRILLIATVVILMFPSISKYRPFIIRDFGYLSAYLWSLYFIFRFCATLQKQHLVGWLFFAVFGCLFRFEGIAFVLIAPYFLILFTAKRTPYRQKILGGLSMTIVILSCALLYWYGTDKYDALIEIARLQGNDIHSITDLFFANMQQRFGDNANVPGVLSASMGDVAYELIRRMAVLYFIFAVYAYYKGLVFNTRLTKRVWLIFLTTNLVVLITFSLYNSFLVSRYTMATALTLLILAPFAIDKLLLAFSKTNTVKQALIFFAFTVLALTSLNGLLDVRTNKYHLKNAGIWMKNNLEAGTRIYSNNKLIVYYSGLNPGGLLTTLYSDLQMVTHIASGQTAQHFDYIALVSRNGDPETDPSRQTLSYHFGLPIKVFEGERGSSVYIFKTKFHF